MEPRWRLASLSQVHRGVLHDEGKIVSIKVQRPGIRKKVQMDFDLFGYRGPIARKF